MLGLSALGTVHTAFALVAVVCGYAMIFRSGRIGADLSFGKAYIVCTAITCLTGFGLFRHGGFNIAHGLGALTLVVLGVAVAAGRSREVSRLAIYVETLGYSLTLFFHMIPGMTETFTRLPVGSPWFSGPEDPKLQQVIGLILLAFLVLMAWQVRRIWKTPASGHRTFAA
ncbi:hypothetical protein G8A07_14665 [Roseateles sp. DAIF2]|uniref:hypothetical protein n=1 Tax=Roseateles sp. DAIF2 TaxID=2714952 RepID=UPI0018A318B4|nr:hypothetical protein [Roseateles sp. DAIF2]QPF74035.1 hypothetical protein G8A07_14665 [Roseateles sp. DAIF2]